MLNVPAVVDHVDCGFLFAEAKTRTGITKRGRHRNAGNVWAKVLEQRVKTITLIEVQKRNKERANIYLDDEYAFSVGLMEAAKLRKGQTLSDQEVAAMQGEDAVAKAVDSAARFLSYRPRSVDEVRRNLTGKSIDAPVVDAALERLTAMGYLDDAAFARFWVQNRTAFKPLGPGALRYELRRKGISDDDIEAVLEDVDPEAAAYQAAQSQLRRLRAARPDAKTFRTKLSSFLQRRGFNYGVINEVVRRLWDELEDDMSASHDSDGDEADGEYVDD